MFVMLHNIGYYLLDTFTFLDNAMSSDILFIRFMFVVLLIKISTNRQIDLS